MKEIQVASEIKNIEKIIAFTESELEKLDCPMKIQTQLDIAIDEIASNICRYAYGDAAGEITVRLDFDPEDRMLNLVFMDGGMPYNPLEKPDPDVTLSAEEREIGGLGIFMVKKSMDDMLYEYSEGRNILTLKKKLA